MVRGLSEVIPAATRSTRLAANAGLLAAILFGVVAYLTTQVPDIRETLPSGEDPYDLIVSIAIVLVPFLVVVTWIRSVRNRGPEEMPGPARRLIHRGIALCLGLVGAATAAQLVAIVGLGAPDAPTPVVGLIVVTGLVTLGAAILLIRAIRTPTTAPADPTVAAPEPDTIDDLVSLAADTGLGLRRSLPAVGAAIARIGAFIDALASAPMGPRHHRAAWILGASVAVGASGVIWHAVREGAWASLAAAAVYGSILAVIVAVGLGVLGSYLRVLRAD